MKKKYVKPTIYVEEFVLAQRIAACGASPGTANHSDPNSCNYNMYGDLIYGSAPLCQEIVTDEELGEYCYNNPTPETSIFGS